jgi:hypothetical protein
MRTRSQKQTDVMDWFGEMLDCVSNLAPDERAAFEEWDQQRPQGVATSDWPGLDKSLRKKPWDLVH